jgi:hypothetical protein
LRGYLENFEDGDKKIVMINTGLGNIPVQLQKPEFLIGMQLKIRISSRSQIKQERNEQKLGLKEVFAFIQAASLPEISKTLWLRDLAESNDIPSERIASRIPL